MDQIGRLFGPQFNEIKPLNKTDKAAQNENVSFKSTNPVQGNYKYLNMDTLVGLKQLAMTGFTPEMADDILATPYVSLDYNS